MSQTLVFAAPEQGKMVPVAEFANSWGSAARVWTSLCERYFGDATFWLTRQRELYRLWDLVRDEHLSAAERWVFASTFDYALVAAPDFLTLACHFRDFVKLYPTSSADNLPAMADLLVKLAGTSHGLDFQPHAVGWQQTTVSDCLWYIREGEEVMRPYDLARDQQHHWIPDLIAH